MVRKKRKKKKHNVLFRHDINIKKNYRVVRKIVDITHPEYHRKFYKTWDEHMLREGYPIPIRFYKVDEEKQPLLIFFHGGGWVTGGLDSYDRVCANLAKITKHQVIAVDYRLAPEYKFPTAPEDCYHVVREIYETAESRFGVTTDQITLIGDSAGANLAAAVSLMARDRGEFAVKHQILIYPAVDHDFAEDSRYPSMTENGTGYGLTAKRMRDYKELYLEDVNDQYHPYFAPILKEDLSCQPDTLVITAEYDPLRDEGEAYAQKLKEYGCRAWTHRVLGVKHGFFTLSIRRKEVADTYRLINRFLKKVETKQNEKEKEIKMASAR